LIEEYFDGEVKGQTGEQIGAHLAACADCSAALDALSFEQEIYARYDRGGLEVTPDLWARVSAEIARTTPPHESPDAGRPFLSRARDYFAAALGALAVRPALASSLALFVVAAAAGTLWLARRPKPAAPTQSIAQSTPAPVKPAAPEAEGGINPERVDPITPNADVPVAPVYESREPSRGTEVARGANPTQPAGGAVTDVMRVVDEPTEPKKDPRIVEFEPEGTHANDADALLVAASAPRREAAGTDERLLDPAQKDVARHVERAQMLLRSIKNARAGDAGGADIAYEKDLSRKLLAENATLQLEAEVKGDKETQQVLDRIEPFLLEIANMGEKPSREEVRSIRERVRQNEIVAALEVY
jgi:hypothetical protein